MGYRSAPKITFHLLAKGFRIPTRTLLKKSIINLFRKENKSLDSLSIIFCSDDYLLDINRKYLNHDYYTDIITFDLSAGDETIGEIYISADRITENASKFEVPISTELTRVIFHGCLHLCGYEDKTAQQKKIMRAKENHYLALL